MAWKTYNIDNDSNFPAYDSDMLPDQIKINPEFYLHTAILKAQDCLLKDNAEMGFSQFLLITDHIEKLCNAANLTPEDYDEQIKEYQVKNENKQEAQLIRMVKLANHKLGILLKEVFSHKVYTDKIEETRGLKKQPPAEPPESIIDSETKENQEVTNE